MRLALDDAGLPVSAVGYVSAHGTATDRGDIAESHTTAEVLGSTVPISSMKSYLGHARCLRGDRSLVGDRDDAPALVCTDAQPGRGNPACAPLHPHHRCWLVAGYRLRYEQ